MRDVAPATLRIIAWLVDLLLVGLPYMFFLSRLAEASTIPEILDAVLALFLMAVFFGITWFIFNLMMVSSFGGTIGKLLSGIRVVREDGKPIGIKKAFVREVIGKYAAGVFFGIGFFWILKDEMHRGWHDLIAETKVVVFNKLLMMAGVTVAAGLILFESFLAINLAGEFSKRLPVYESIVSELVKEFQKEEKKDRQNPPVEDQGLLKVKETP